MAILAIIALFFIGIFLLSKVSGSKSSVNYNNEEPQEKRKYSEIRKFHREKLFYRLRGVAYADRTGAYDEVQNDDMVYVRFDTNNEFDKNALGVYTESNKLLGYIQRDQRRLIKTMRDNPNNFARIAEKIFLPPNDDHKDPYRGIELEIWVGFPDAELQTEKQRRINGKRFSQVSESFRAKAHAAKDVRESNPMEAIKILEEISLEMAEYNKTTTEDYMFPLPLNELTILTNKLGLYAKTIALWDNYAQVCNISEKQRDQILKRVEKAKIQLGQSGGQLNSTL